MISREMRSVKLTVNGQSVQADLEPRLLLSDFLRHELRLTGTHVGCEHGVCGACTVLVNGEPVRSCLMFAVQAANAEVTTVEGLAGPDGLSPLQEAFCAAHGLQCGFCTPGLLTTLTAFLRETPTPTPDQIRESVSGNLCRCTGYATILQAVQLATGQTPTRDR
jgi:carbon-monoxide dehydrogenase small subunit